MKFFAFILYGGPDQLMPLTSGLTAIFAFLLIFWNKVLFLVGRVLRFFRPDKKDDITVVNPAERGPATVEPPSSQSEVKAGQPS